MKPLPAQRGSLTSVRPHDAPQPRSVIENTAYPRVSARWTSGLLGSSFVPPQPWKIPITGYGPSAPSTGAGGNATETSIGTPSKLGICAVVVPHQRCPDPWTAQLTGDAVFVNTCGIAASAVDGT